MKVLIPFKDSGVLASNLRYAGYEVIEFTDDIQQFALRTIHCDAVFMGTPCYHTPEVLLSIGMAQKFKKPIIKWDSAGKNFVENTLVGIGFDIQTLDNPRLPKPDHRTLPKILIVGPGRCGKDSLGEFIHKNSQHTYAGSTSKFLAKYVAKEFKISEEQAYQLRHGHRQRWFEIGNRIRESDHGKLQNEALAAGNVVAGIRDFREIAWACYNEIYAHIVWIDTDVDQDPTLTFTTQDIAAMLQGKTTKFTIIKNNKDSQFFAEARKFIECIK